MSTTIDLYLSYRDEPQPIEILLQNKNISKHLTNMEFILTLIGIYSNINWNLF